MARVNAWYAAAADVTTGASIMNGKASTMKNHQQLLNLVARAERGALLPGEAALLRDALQLLDDMATTLDKLMGRHPGDYQVDDTGTMAVVDMGGIGAPVKSTGPEKDPYAYWKS